jgi:hypothetical protein
MVEGDRELRLAFKDAGWALADASAIDLALIDKGQPRCVRLNLFTHTADSTWTTGPWWLDFRLRSYYPVGATRPDDAGPPDGHHDGHSGIIRFGRFVGPVNLGLALEFGVAGCAGTCLSDQRYFGFVGAGPSLQNVIVDRGRFLLTSELAYDVMMFQEQLPEARSTATSSRRELFLHGPRLGLGIFQATRPGLVGVVRDLRTMYGVELFGAYRRQEAGGAVVVGFSLVAGGPLL